MKLEKVRDKIYLCPVSSCLPQEPLGQSWVWQGHQPWQQAQPWHRLTPTPGTQPATFPGTRPASCVGQLHEAAPSRHELVGGSASPSPGRSACAPHLPLPHFSLSSQPPRAPRVPVSCLKVGLSKHRCPRHFSGPLEKEETGLSAVHGLAGTVGTGDTGRWW